MNLYKLTQEECTGYDSYDSVIVCAETSENAAKIHPWEYDLVKWSDQHRAFYQGEKLFFWSSVWVTRIENVKVELIGVAVSSLEEGVVLASFNAE